MAMIALFAFGVKLLDKLRILSDALIASSIIESNTLDMALEAEIAMLSDYEIVALYERSPRLNIPNWIGFGFAKVPPFALITPFVLVKFGHIPAWEVRTMDLVRSHTTIPVPKVYRSFGRNVEGWWMSYLAMQYIPGRPLDGCWNELSVWRKIWIAWTLRGYIRQLRRIRIEQIIRQIPGPISNDPSQPEKCYNPVTGEDTVGPFATQAELADWMNGRLRASQAVMQYGYHCQPFDESEPLVLVHGDIQMRNLILGDDGKLWMIDWDHSGVYPPWFESVCMRMDPEPRFWTWMKRFAAGWYPASEDFDNHVHWAVSDGSSAPTPPVPPKGQRVPPA